MTTDFRTELERLVDLYYALGGNWSPHGYTDTWNDALASARIALATSPPEPLRPIPVSERLPEEGDCDTDGSCWVYQPDESWPESPEWKLMRNKYVSTIYRSTHWLPYNAIPVPEVTP